MEEVWKDVAGYEGYYQVSNMGRVKSIQRVIKAGRGRKGTRIAPSVVLKPIPTIRWSYLVVSLSRNHKSLTHRVNRLVALAFIPNPDNKPQVNHINRDKNDNRAISLEWVTPSENMRHAWDSGLNKSKRSGEHGQARKIFQYSLTGEFIKEWPCINDAVKAGFNQAWVCAMGIQKTCKGFTWKFHKQ